MHKNFLVTGAVMAGLSVLLGAFAAHSLKQVLATDVLQVFETAVRYQMYHALALLFAGIIYYQFPVKQLRWAGNFFAAGIVLFSGSLYLLCYIKHQNIPALWVGAITPIGGICFITGWIFLVSGILKKARV
jgi:uncharacterized membrane protein YgdD (TMEM256/DUF423 family)